MHTHSKVHILNCVIHDIQIVCLSVTHVTTNSTQSTNVVSPIKLFTTMPHLSLMAFSEKSGYQRKNQYFPPYHVQLCIMWQPLLFYFWIREALKTNFCPKLGIWSNRLEPPTRHHPTLPVHWDSQKGKKNISILHFRLFWAYNFFMKKFIFLVGMTNGGPIPSWIDKILPPQLCTMCFITFLATYQSKVCSGKIG